MNTLTAVVLVPVLVLCALPAQADTYKWTDAGGQVHFGDTPPAGARNVVNLSPAATGSASSSAGSHTAEPAAAKPVPDNSGRSMLERHKRMADILQQENEEREAAEKKAAEEKAERQRHCNILRNYQKTMSGGRVYDLDEKGERVFLDDQKRAELEENINSRISESCD